MKKPEKQPPAPPEPDEIVRRLLANDPYSRWLGIKLLEVGQGRVKLQMCVREEMCNGFGTCHGGVTFAFADSALAFASNSRGNLSVLLNASMSYPAAVRPGDTLIATAEEMSLSDKIGIYQIKVEKSGGELAGLFKGTVYRTGKAVL